MLPQKTPDVEVWMRGPIPEVPPLLQPIAHALLQASEEVSAITAAFDNLLLWERPRSMASVGFHLKHITGVVDRLFTYALDKPLSEQQFEYLRMEKEEQPHLTALDLSARFEKQVGMAINQLKETEEHTFTEAHFLGRKRIPTTLIGLLFHAAEHTQRHVGQLLVTAKLVPLLNAVKSTHHTDT